MKLIHKEECEKCYCKDCGLSIMNKMFCTTCENCNVFEEEFQPLNTCIYEDDVKTTKENTII